METKNLDVVYILGTGSMWNDNEIRYSLRSVDRYLPHRNVYVIGERLHWFNGITHIPENDPHQNKTANGLHKIFRAASEPEISDPFILMNDDFFFWDFVSEIVPYRRSTISDSMRMHPTKGGYYYNSLKETKDLLDGLGLDDLDFEVHYPALFYKENLRNAIRLGLRHSKHFLIRSFYHNLYQLPGIETMDFKINSWVDWAFQKNRPNVHLYSVSDFAVGNREIQEWIDRKFPRPCRFENDGGRGRFAKPNKKGVMRIYAAVDFDYNGHKVYAGNIIPNNIVENIVGNPAFDYKWRQC